MVVDSKEEPLLQNTYNKYVSLPIQHSDMDKFYNTHVDTMWFVNEVDLTRDIIHWQKLSDDEKYFIKHILAFFAASDGIIMENIFINFANEIQRSEARSFYAIQNFMEDIHSKMYSKLIITYIEDPNEQNKLFNSIETMPAIQKKAKWAEKWISSNANLAKRLVAFMIVEGLFFSGAFCSIYWLGEKNVMPGLCASNQFIARDEALHVEFGVLLYTKYIVNKLSQDEITDLIVEAVDIEKFFITEALPCSLLGMNAKLMTQYIEYVAHRLMCQLGYTTPYKDAKNPFGFMDKIVLQNQTSFFDERVTEYRKNKTVKKEEIVKLNFDADF